MDKKKLLIIGLVAAAVVFGAIAIVLINQEPEEPGIYVDTPRFRYAGVQVWLYRDASGSLSVLYGHNVEAASHLGTAGRRATTLNNLVGEGEWAVADNVETNLRLSISHDATGTPAEATARAQNDPWYILEVNREALPDDIPTLASEEEQQAFRDEFVRALGLNPVATMNMQDGGTIKLELYPQYAPNTVNSFVWLIDHGFYDGLTFHRAAPGFVIQGGDPMGTGAGGPGFSIPGEFFANGFYNPLRHTRGILSMARSPHGYDTAGSQFFIVLGDAPFLDGDYAAFGRVIEGMEVADRIALMPTEDERLIDQPVIEFVTVETHGVEYSLPYVFLR